MASKFKILRALFCILPSSFSIALPRGPPALLDSRELQIYSTSSGCTEISPPPNGSTCGVLGNIENPHISADPSFAANLSQCQRLCTERELQPHVGYLPGTCASFSFDHDTTNCSIYFSSVEEMSFRPDPKSGELFYDSTCFHCPAHCPQQNGVNLLQNSGFEASPTFLGPWRTDYGSLVSPGHHSQHALLCPSKQMGCILDQDAQPCPGYTYALSMDYKIDSSHLRPFEAYILYGNGEFSGGFSYTNNTWQTLRVWFPMYTNVVNSLSIAIFPAGARSTNDANVYIDNVRLARDILDYQPHPHEYVENGNFETGQLAPFKISPAGAHQLEVVSPGIHSKYALEWKGDGSLNAGEELEYTLNLKAGSLYLFGYQAKKIQKSAHYPLLRLGQLTYLAPNSRQVGNSFNFSLPFVAETDTVKFSMQFFLGGRLLIDNISVKRV